MSFSPHPLTPPTTTFLLPDNSGSLDYAADSLLIPGTGTVTGWERVDGTLSLDYTFDKKSAGAYALEALQAAKGLVGPGASPESLAREFYRAAIRLRNSYAGSSENLNIRDVEYFARGYAGGLLLRHPGELDANDASNDIANSSGPVGALIYNGVKELDNLAGIPIQGPGEEPASEPGGLGANADGWLRGNKQQDLGDAIGEYFFDSSRASPSPSRPPPPSSRSAPWGRSPSLEGGGDGLLSMFAFGVDGPGHPVYLDPEARAYNLFAVDGPAVRSVTVPGAGGPGDVWDLIVDGSTFAYRPGSTFSFVDHGFADGVHGFVLGDPDPGLWGGHFTTGLDFVGSGTAIVGQLRLPAAAATSVDEPSPVLLVVPAALGLVAFGRRGRRPLAPAPVRPAAA